MRPIDIFKSHLKEKKALKIISGIDNFDINKAKMVVEAATIAKASAVDVACSEDIIKMAKNITNLPVFASSVIAQDLVDAVNFGADAIEIGNFDVLYRKGQIFSAKQVLDLTIETLNLLGSKKNDIFISVTIPGHIFVDQQISLAQELEKLNIDLIQTEGAQIADVKSSNARGLLEIANVSISNTIELSRNTSIPIMTASGITPTTAKLAFAAGASAIGVGSCVNKLSSSIEMIAVISSLREIISSSNNVVDNFVSC